MTRLLVLATVAALGIACAQSVSLTRVSSNSMRPLLRDGQHVLLWRVGSMPSRASRGVGVARGDVIVFKAPHDDKLLVKRVVALAGDSVRIDEGLLFVNGRVVYEPYARHASAAMRESDRWPASSAAGPVTVPHDMMFVLGDNRSASSDSRVWGPVRTSALVARVWLPLF